MVFHLESALLLFAKADTRPLPWVIISVSPPHGHPIDPNAQNGSNDPNDARRVARRRRRHVGAAVVPVAVGAKVAAAAAAIVPVGVAVAVRVKVGAVVRAPRQTLQ